MLRLRWLALIIAVILTPIGSSGCNDKNQDTAIDVRIEDEFSIDFSRPEYLENQNDPPPKISQEIETWTPTAKEVAELFDQGDQEGALRLLYQDILETNPLKEDQFFFSLFNDPWLNLFHDPELVFRLYRDNDRTELSEDEKAACDMMVALTYDLGDFSGAREETFYPEGTEEQRARYVEYLEEKDKLAFEMYKKIADRYPQSNVSVLAELLNVDSFSIENETGLLKMKDEIEKDYLDSIYNTYVHYLLQVMYYQSYKLHLGDEEEMVMKSLHESEIILELPNILLSSPAPEYTSVHDLAERNIERLRPLIERKGWSMPE